MDAGRYDALRRLIGLGTSSLLQYVSESSPWSPRESAGKLDAILTFAREERDEITRFTRWLQKKHGRIAISHSYPSHFTTMNFVTLAYLLPKLIAENTRELAEIERLASQADDQEIHALIQGYLEMKRRHLRTLKELTETPSPAVAS